MAILNRTQNSTKLEYRKTLAARGLEEPCASFPDFCDNRQFHVNYFEEFLIH